MAIKSNMTQREGDKKGYRRRISWEEKPIDWQNVTSSNIYMIGYDEDENALYVTFHSGSTYEYINVPKHVFISFLAAESKGKYFYSWVRNRYNWVRLH